MTAEMDNFGSTWPEGCWECMMQLSALECSQLVLCLVELDKVQSNKAIVCCLFFRFESFRR